MREYAIAYAKVAVEADRACRVPMTHEQIDTIVYKWADLVDVVPLAEYRYSDPVQAVEAHHGVGAKP